MTKTLIYIAFGGALGSVLRFLTTMLINKYWQNNFPLATLTINIFGCFLIGFLIACLDTNSANSNLKLLLITGFCGGYTTFSAFGLENVNLLQSQNIFYAILYISASVFLGLTAVWLGTILGK
jgi:fluoride exporter